MAEGSDLPPFLINNPSNKEMSVMTENTIARKEPVAQPRKRIHIEPGEIYGSLTVIKEAPLYIPPSGKGGNRRFECLCECGNTTVAMLNDLRRGYKKSCGCLQGWRSNGGPVLNRPLYQVWVDMIHRCTNSKHNAYKYYGKRGITVCKEWRENSKVFISWALSNGWEKDLRIDRVDNESGYSPGNVRFVDTGLSGRNKRLLYANNTSGYSGASYMQRNQKWMAQLQCDGVKYRLGYFETAIEAAMARDNKARELNMGHPLNFPQKEN